MNDQIKAHIAEVNAARDRLLAAVHRIPTWHDDHERAREWSPGHIGALVYEDATACGPRLMGAVLDYVRAEAMLALVVRLDLVRRLKEPMATARTELVDALTAGHGGEDAVKIAEAIERVTRAVAQDDRYRADGDGER